MNHLSSAQRDLHTLSAKCVPFFIVMLLLTACGAQPVSGQVATHTAATLAFPPADTQPAQVPTHAPTNTQQAVPVSVAPLVNPATVNVTQLNIRVGPGINYDAEKTLNQGDKLSLLGKSSDGNWYEVQLQDGSGGWVFSAYVTTLANVAALPVIPAPDATSSAPAAATAAPGTPSAGGSIPLTGATSVPTVLPTVTAAAAANPLPIVVAIANNQAQVTLSRFPAGKPVLATLGALGTNKSVRIAGATTDGSGSASFNFSMPLSWPDGTPLTQQSLYMTVTTTDGTFSRTLSFPFFSGR